MSNSNGLLPKSHVDALTDALILGQLSVGACAISLLLYSIVGQSDAFYVVNWLLATFVVAGSSVWAKNELSLFRTLLSITPLLNCVVVAFAAAIWLITLPWHKTIIR